MSAVETVELRPGYRISRLVKGGWQLAGDHGPVERERAIADMLAFPKAGITAFDCADIYTGVEELIGAFRRRYGDLYGGEALRDVRVHTKFAPDRDALPVSRAYTREIIERSLRRLGQERLDLVQFHWWRYDVPGCDRYRGLARRAARRRARSSCWGPPTSTPRMWPNSSTPTFLWRRSRSSIRCSTAGRRTAWWTCWSGTA